MRSANVAVLLIVALTGCLQSKIGTNDSGAGGASLLTSGHSAGHGSTSGDVTSGDQGATSGDVGATTGAGGSTGTGHTTSSGDTVSTSVGTSGGPSTAASSGTGNLGGQCMGGMPPADPKCYWEQVCPTADLSDLANSYSPGNWMATTMEMTKRRYPSQNCLMMEYQNDIGNYVDSSSFGALAESLMTMTHEETHGYDYDHALGKSDFYLFWQCNSPKTVPWIEAFGRSEILPFVQGSSTNLYDGTYLTGTQGTYGWTEVLDEWNAYVDGMAGIGLYGDYVPGGISGTDGALAFAYYVELYLKVARMNHPSDYAQIKGDPQVVDFLRQEWNRMHFFLSFAEVYPNLSIEAANIKQVLYDPANQGEIEQVIGVTLTATNCN